MVPPKRKRGALSSEEKTYFQVFYFMKSDVGSLALLDRNLPHGEERAFEMLFIISDVQRRLIYQHKSHQS